MEIYLRKLKHEDSYVSYKWRNDPVIWKFTGNRPTQIVTLEIEKKWLKGVLNNKNQLRFAICIKETNEYIGNVQLTDITKIDAKFHIFIGNRNFWNKGIAKKATKQLLEFVKNELEIKSVYLIVDLNNIYAIKAYKKAGFRFTNLNKGIMSINLHD